MNNQATQVPPGWGVDPIEHLPGRIIRQFPEDAWAAVNPPSKDGAPYCAFVWRGEADGGSESLYEGKHSTLERAVEACCDAVRANPRYEHLNYEEAFARFEDGNPAVRANVRIDNEEVVEALLNNAPFLEKHRGDLRFISSGSGIGVIAIMRGEGEDE